MRTIVIAGGRGLIGSALARKLRERNYIIKILTREKSLQDASPFVYWNPASGEIEKEKLLPTDVVINLAGENIANGRWTKSKKGKILQSRIDSTRFLYSLFASSGIKKFISASAVGYYGTVTTDKVFDEYAPPGKDFLARVCTQWENEALKFSEVNIQTAILRIGVVLSKEGGAFKKLTASLNFGVINSLGKGNQILPWIHMDDLTEMIIFLIKNQSLEGIFNAVAPDPISFNEFVQEITKLKKVIRLPNVPAFLIKLLLGEMSGMVLEGSKVSADKIISRGFNFQYPDIKSALENLFASGEQ